MLKQLCMAMVLAAFSAGTATAAEPVSAPETSQAANTIRGRDLMTPGEWREHRRKLQSLATPEERRAYRQEHRKMLEDRAREKGLILRDGRGWRRGAGPGAGPRPMDGGGPAGGRGGMR